MDFIPRLIFKNEIITIMGIFISIGGFGLMLLGVYLIILSTIGVLLK